MRGLFIILLFISQITNAQFGGRSFLKTVATTPPPVGGNTAFSFSEIPYSNIDFINPGRGAEQWHNGSDRIPNPSETSDLPSLDLYYRFEWARVEGATQGSYVFGQYTVNSPGDTTWNYFDNLFHDAIEQGQQFSLGIMPYYSDGGFVSYAGGTSSYPLYLHNLMQAESIKDQLTPVGLWMPNWNSANYIARLRALHTAMNTYILNTVWHPQTGPHAGEAVRYRDVVYCIDIRGFGNYGEWHSGDMYAFGSFPNGTQPTAATLKAIIDAHTQIFQDWPLSMMVAGFNGTGGAPYINIFHQYDDVGWYALTATNAWGKVGYRRDQVGGTDGYLIDLLQENTTVYNGQQFNTLFLNLYKTAPGTGEPLPGAANANQMIDLENQVITYGATSFGNGNWLGYPNASTRDRIRAAWKRSGYRYKITIGNAPTVINKTVPFNIAASWVNVGITPTYNSWTVQYELQTGGGTVVWTGTSSKVLKLFRPDQGTVETTDVLTVPNSVTSGTYKLVVRVKDPLNNYRPNMKLAIQGRNADGSYTIFNSVTVNSII
jgi:hypothetical protein